MDLESLHGAYTHLGLGEAVGGDRAFEQMVLAHLIKPTSKAQVPRIPGDLGLDAASVRILFRSLGRCVERGYREAISQAQTGVGRIDGLDQPARPAGDDLQPSRHTATTGRLAATVECRPQVQNLLARQEPLVPQVHQRGQLGLVMS